MSDSGVAPSTPVDPLGAGPAPGRRVIRPRPEPLAAVSLPSDLHPVLRRIYRARDVSDASELQCDLQRLHHAGRLGGIDAAVELLRGAVTQGERILVVGDFDADGATSSALAIRALRAMGAEDPQYIVPNRFAFGYGLTPEIVAAAASREPDLLLTVDNGIASHEGVAAARARGWRVLITDHHLAGAQLPAADAIVNPNLPGDPFPSKHLAGVGVVFYVLASLRTRLRAQGWFAERGIAEPNLAALLDLVALGTVADVVPLDANNRILVSQGIARIRRGHCVPGILALLELAGRDPARLTAQDLGFSVAPRLNAAGRLQDMSVGIECLLCEDAAAARRLAAELDRINLDRRAIESRMREHAFKSLEQLCLDEASELPYGLALFDDSWHQGVIGIVAARVKEVYHRPVVAFAPGLDGEIKGSARSVRGFHIRDALEAVATQQPDLVLKFGGHAMAAGLSIRRGALGRFRRAFDAEVRRHLDADDLQGVVYTDGQLDAAHLSLDLAEAIRNGGPWGQGFPEPVFDGEFRVVHQRVVGEQHLKWVLCPSDGERLISAIAFRVDRGRLQTRYDRIRAAYRLEVNEYQGQIGPQLVLEWFEPLSPSP